MGLLRERGHSTVAISHASIVVPFLLGALLALPMHPVLSLPDVSFTIFALFLGAAMSVTAFPVLARILTDRKMTRTRLGVIAITCAAVDDASAWCLLAFVVGVAKAQVNQAAMTAGLTVGYIALMFIVVRPLVHRWCKWLGDKSPSPEVLAIVFVAVLTSALITEWIGEAAARHPALESFYGLKWDQFHTPAAREMFEETGVLLARGAETLTVGQRASLLDDLESERMSWRSTRCGAPTPSAWWRRRRPTG